MKPARRPDDVGLLVTFQVSNDYLVITARPCYKDHDRGGKIEFPRSYGPLSDQEGLRIRAQGNLSNGCLQVDGDRDGIYGADVEYEGTFGPSAMERGAKVLRKVEKALAKATEENGRPADFPELLGRVARALGATFLATYVAAPNWYAEPEYLCQKIGRGVDEVRYALRQARDDGAVKITGARRSA